MATQERTIIENLFMIADKEKNDVPFILNHTQAKLDDALTGRDIVSKARQEGISAYVLALFLVRCLSIRNTRAVVISHDQESTERLFRRVKYYLDNLRGPKAVIETSSKRELSFPKTNSVFFVGTAGARKFGRGDTITDLHCSEVAFWENPKELTAGLFQAVPRNGTVILESTSNGRNWYYNRVMSALQGKGRYKVHFFNWQDFPEYSVDLTPEQEEAFLETLDPDLEEVELYEGGLLTSGQLMFRRERLEEMDYDLDLFKQEYPMNIEESFRASGRSIFGKVVFRLSPAWERESSKFHRLSNHPHPKGRYVIGADVSGGVGGDFSVAEIFDVQTGEQVGEWRDNRTEPDVFGEKIAELGKLYNRAYTCVESNNHGIVTLKVLSERYPQNLIHKKPITTTNKDSKLMNLGLMQTSRTKFRSLGTLRKFLATLFTIHSPVLKAELDTFIETEEGKLQAEEGAFDDCVMASAAAAYVFDKAQLLLAPGPEQRRSLGLDPFTIEGIIQELAQRGNLFPIKPQIVLGEGYASPISRN